MSLSYRVITILHLGRPTFSAFERSSVTIEGKSESGSSFLARLSTKTLGRGALRFGQDALRTSRAVKFAFKGSGNSSVGPLSPSQCTAQMYVFLVIKSTVKFSREQALIQRWQRSIPCDGFGNGMNVFIPNFTTSFSDLCSFSGYLESLLHVPQQQFLVPTMFSKISQPKHYFQNKIFAYISL